MRLEGENRCTICHVASSLFFPTTEPKFQVKHSIECGWVHAEGLYVTIMFSKA